MSSPLRLGFEILCTEVRLTILEMITDIDSLILLISASRSMYLAYASKRDRINTAVVLNELCDRAIDIRPPTFLVLVFVRVPLTLQNPEVVAATMKDLWTQMQNPRIATTLDPPSCYILRNLQHIIHYRLDTNDETDPVIRYNHPPLYLNCGTRNFTNHSYYQTGPRWRDVMDLNIGPDHNSWVSTNTIKDCYAEEDFPLHLLMIMRSAPSLSRSVAKGYWL